ncbi:hypothetical protein ACWEKU_08790 [Streptomyces californicus]
MRQKASPWPKVGALVVDAGRAGRVGVFRGVAGPYWSLRPVCGGIELEALPEQKKTSKGACRSNSRQSPVSTLTRSSSA